MTPQDKQTIIQKRKEGYTVYEIREIMEKRYSVLDICTVADQAKVMTNQRRRAVR